jgi:N-methylhydantoinase A
VLGRLNPAELLGGRMKIDRELAAHAITEGIAEPLGVDVRTAARGAIDALISNVVTAVRLLAIERGIDARAMTLVAFGGAGPMHAGALARELGMQQVLIPRNPGVLCALGLLVADLGTNYVRTLITRCDDPDLRRVADCYAAMEMQGRSWLEREGVPRRDHVLARSADMRYVGQEHWLTVSVSGGTITEDEVHDLVASFHDSHERIHGYCSRDGRVEIVAVRVRAYAVVGKPPVNSGRPSRPTDGLDVLMGVREVDFGDDRRVECPVYRRNGLVPGWTIRGPAILEQMDTTTVVFPDQHAEVDTDLNVVIRDALV